MGFKKRYDPMNIQVITNGFWMKSDKEIDKRSMILDRVNRLVITRYPNMMPKEKFLQSLETIRKRHRFSFDESVEKGYAKNVDCNLEVWEVDRWCSFEFLENPSQVDKFCEAQANCTQLLSDGRLARCATAAYADKNPLATRQFLDNRKDIFFDIENDTRSISEWRYKWPMDACQYCTMWKCKESMWKNDPSIRKTPKKLF